MVPLSLSFLWLLCIYVVAYDNIIVRTVVHEKYVFLINLHFQLRGSHHLMMRTPNVTLRMKLRGGSTSIVVRVQPRTYTQAFPCFSVHMRKKNFYQEGMVNFVIGDYAFEQPGNAYLPPHVINSDHYHRLWHQARVHADVHVPAILKLVWVLKVTHSEWVHVDTYTCTYIVCVDVWVQWNLSIADALGTSESVLISKVSTFQW